jgi:hypothetical protein
MKPVTRIKQPASRIQHQASPTTRTLDPPAPLFRQPKQTTTKNKASEKAAPPVATNITKQQLQIFRLPESRLITFALIGAPAGQTAERLFVLDLFPSFSIKGKRKKQSNCNLLPIYTKTKKQSIEPRSFCLPAGLPTGGR